MAERGIDYLQSPTKRRFDVFGGLALAGALLPAGLAFGTAAAVDSRSRNPIFTQERIGQHDSRFRVLKIKTLSERAGFTSTDTFGTFDERASWLGQFMRRSGIDEMPQLINVLKGQMSLVGLRPMLVQSIDMMSDADPKQFADWYEYYLAVRPGLVGPSQALRHHYLNGVTPEVYRQSMTLDLEYMEKASLAKDIAMVMRSPIDMLRANVGVINNVSAETPSQETLADTATPV